MRYDHRPNYDTLRLCSSNAETITIITTLIILQILKYKHYLLICLNDHVRIVEENLLSFEVVEILFKLVKLLITILTTAGYCITNTY